MSAHTGVAILMGVLLGVGLMLEPFARRSGRTFVAVACVGLLFLMLGGCAALTPRTDWSSDNTVAEIAFQISNVADAFQTAQIQHRDDLHEGENFTVAVLGREPSTRGTAMYFATMGLSHYLISMALPARWRPWFQGATLIYSGSTVLKNCTDHGLLCGGAQ